MNKKVFFRLIYFPIGLIKALINMTNVYCRDFENKIRHKSAIIDGGTCLTDDTIIGAHSHILQNCIINKSKIGNYSYIGRNSLIQNANIGNFCSIANDVLIGLGKHPLDMFSTSPVFYHKKNALRVSVVADDKNIEEYERIIIGNDVWIGARSIVMDGVIIGDGAVVAAGSVITKDVEPYMIVAGAPAKPIRKRTSDEKIKYYLQTEWWKLDPFEAYKLFESKL